MVWKKNLAGRCEDIKTDLRWLTVGLLVWLASPAEAVAGDFYRLHPAWAELVYYLVSVVLLTAAVFISYGIYDSMKGGRLGMPWLVIVASLALLTIRTVLGFLTVLDVAYFKAAVFALLDLGFFGLFLAGLLWYRSTLA